MKVYLSYQRGKIHAEGDFSLATKELVVKKGSSVSIPISTAPSFRGKASITKQRNGTVENGIVICDVRFKSPSTAGNFVTGKSTNGLTAWKTKDGTTIGELIKQQAGEKNAQ